MTAYNCVVQLFSCKMVHHVIDQNFFFHVTLLKLWPSNSPDLNPIENMWTCIKRQIRDPDTSSIQCLQAAIQDIWDIISLEYIQNLADSLPKRLEGVKKSEVTLSTTLLPWILCPIPKNCEITWILWVKPRQGVRFCTSFRGGGSYDIRDSCSLAGLSVQLSQLTHSQCPHTPVKHQNQDK